MEMDDAARQGAQYQQGPTYFEITTAASLLHFARRAVDVAVLEVGLGGRLDSTNVCEPVLSVITSISLDHTRQLGNTLGAIAGEKAGIIKPGVPVVSGVIEPEPRGVIQRIANQRGSPCFQAGRDFEFCYRVPDEAAWTGEGDRRTGALDAEMDFSQRDALGTTEYRNLRLGLLGEHQAANASVAIAAVRHLQHTGWRIDESAIRRGLATARCPARIELMRIRPDVIVDTAHNVASVQALVRVLNRHFPASKRRILIFATSQDKDADGMLQCLLPQFDTAILTRYLNNPRFIPEDTLAAIAGRIASQLNTRQRQLSVSPDPASAWQTARAAAGPDDLICIVGSFFLAAELRELV
jgi:dihydrofolate synthase/folylpolyglutamate synthase